MHLSGMPPAAVGLTRVRNSLRKEFLPAEKHIIRAKVLFSQPFIPIWTKPEPSSGSNTFYKPSHATPHFKIQGLGGLFTFNIQKICEGKAWINVLQQNLLWLHTRGKNHFPGRRSSVYTEWEAFSSSTRSHPGEAAGIGSGWSSPNQTPLSEPQKQTFTTQSCAGNAWGTDHPSPPTPKVRLVSLLLLNVKIMYIKYPENKDKTV